MTRDELLKLTVQDNSYTSTFDFNAEVEEGGLGDALTHGLAASVVSGAVGIVNTGIAFGNMFGLDNEQYKTEEILESWDWDATNSYYQDNKEVIDVIGFAASTLIPGALGFKAAKFAQAAARTGKSKNLLAVGLRKILLPENVTARIQGEIVKNGAHLANRSNAVISASRSGIHQAAVESFFAETAIILSTNQHVTVNNNQLGYFDAMWEQKDGFLLGMGIGTGIGGLVQGAINARAVGSLIDGAEKETNVMFKSMRNLDSRSNRVGFVQGNKVVELVKRSKAANEEFSGLKGADLALFTKRQDELRNEIFEEVAVLTGEVSNKKTPIGRREVSGSMTGAVIDTIDKGNIDQVADTFRGADKIGRYDDTDFLFDPVAQPVTVAGTPKEFTDLIGYSMYGDEYSKALATPIAKRTNRMRTIIAETEADAGNRGISIGSQSQRFREQYINKTVIDGAGTKSPFNTEHLIGTIRHEIGHGNTVYLKQLFDADVFKQYKSEMVALSRKQRPSSWAIADVYNKRIAALESKGSLTVEEINSLSSMKAFNSYMTSPNELMADSWALFNAKDPMLRKFANETGSGTYELFRQNAAVKQRLGKSEKLISLKSGKMYEDSQWAPTIADRGTPKLSGSTVTAGDLGFKLKPDNFSILNTTPDEASAYYFAASASKQKLKRELTTNWDNFYMLNRIQKGLDDGTWAGNVSIKMPDGSTKVLKSSADASILDEFDKTYSKLKGEAATKLNKRELNKRNNTYGEIGRILDTDEDFALAVGRDPKADAFWTRNNDPSKPTVAKIFYQSATDEMESSSSALADVIRSNNHVLEVNEESINAFMGEVDSIVGSEISPSKLNSIAPDPSWMSSLDGEMNDITSQNKLTGILKAFHGKYGESTSKVQAIAKWNEAFKLKGNEHLQQAMANVAQKVEGNPSAVAELNVLDSKLRQHFHKFAPVLESVEGTAEYLGSLANRVSPEVAAKNISKLLETPTGSKLMESLSQPMTIWRRDLQSHVAKIVNQNRFMGANINSLDALLDEGITVIQNAEVYDFWKARSAANTLTVSGKKVAAGARGYGSNLDPEVLYPGAINHLKYKHRAYVVPVADEVWSGNKKGIIGGNTPQELASKEKEVRAAFGNKVKIVTKEEMESNFQRTGEYLDEFSLNEYQTNRDLSNKGVNWDVAPTADTSLVTHYIRDAARDWSGTVDNLTELKYAEEFSALQQMDTVSQHYGTLGAGRQELVDTPFREAQAIMLNRKSSESSKAWRDAQQSVDKLITKAFDGIASTFNGAAKGSISWDEMNKYMDHYGLPKVYTEQTGEMMLSSSKLSEQALKELIPKANGIAATLMLRLDYIQPMVNALSMPIMSVPEMDALFKSIPRVQAQQVAKGIHTVVPGTKFGMGTNLKLQMQAVKDFFSPEGKVMLKKYYEDGIITNIVREMRQVADDITIDVSMNADSIAAKLKNGADRAVNFAAKPADWAEDFVKFVAARQADLVMDAAGITDQAIRKATVRTYTTRVHGNYVHAQRPAIFQGFAGQAIGLFQTYQFNLIQSLLSKVGDKNIGAVASMMGIQAGMFGVQSVPGFKALNEYVAQSSDENNDFYTGVQALAGNEESEWILFGLASNFTKPVFGEGMELYTRGDLNPRTPFIIPTSLSEVPVWQLSTKFVGNLLNAASSLSQGVDAGQVMANTLAHNGVNRPLAGVGDILAGVRTTNQGSLINNLADLSWFGRAARTLGTKTLDESIAVQSFYRTKGYESKRQDALQELGRSAKLMIQSDNYNDDDYMGFMEDYTVNGGTPDKFNKWMHGQALGASESTIQKMYNSNNSNSGKYLQKVMGYDIEEYINPNL